MLATDREVQNAKLRGGRAEYRVRGVKNLVLRVTAKGSSWVFLYTSPRTGKHCKLAIGGYPATSLGQAKDDALGLTRAVRHGHDPLLERRTEQAAETFRALAERYMAEHRRKNVRGERQSRWTGEVQRLLEADILPTIGAHKAKAVTKHDVMGVVEAVADRGAHVLADKVLALIRSIYNWAGATGRLDINPTFGMRKRNVGKARQRTLSEVEIRELWLALKAPTEFSHEISDALRLQLLLGVRIGEVLGASKGEIDLVKQVWVIPAIRTKSHREHRLPLAPLAVSILQAAIERASTSAWLFPSQLDDRPMRETEVGHAGYAQAAKLYRYRWRSYA